MKKSRNRSTCSSTLMATILFAEPCTRALVTSVKSSAFWKSWSAVHLVHLAVLWSKIPYIQSNQSPNNGRSSKIQFWKSLPWRSCWLWVWQHNRIGGIRDHNWDYQCTHIPFGFNLKITFGINSARQEKSVRKQKSGWSVIRLSEWPGAARADFNSSRERMLSEKNIP